MQMVVVVAALNRRAYPLDIRLEVIEPNLDCLTGARVGAKA
jgi:hypothetical protein